MKFYDRENEISILKKNELQSRKSAVELCPQPKEAASYAVYHQW